MSAVLLPDLSENEIIVTSNRRLSSYLLQTYEKRQQDEQRVAWATPKIMPATAWLTELFENNQHPYLLLSAQAEQFLWQAIVNNACEDFPLLDDEHAAQNAMQAATIMQQWQITAEALLAYNNPDVNAFVQWWRSFQQICDAKHWLNQSALPAFLTAHPPSELPKRVFLAGFDSLPPNLAALLALFNTEVLTPSDYQAQAYQLGAPDLDHEYQFMAQWAYQQWQKNPAQSIGCIVPNLLVDRPRVLRAFASAFGEEDTKRVNIAGGVKLIECPLVYAAVQILHLQSDTSLLLSPFWSGSQAEILTALNQLDFSGMRLPSVWAQQWLEILPLWSWPGERVLNSEEYQQAQSLQQQLRQYAGFDWLFGEQTYLQALRSLETLLDNTLFQAESVDQHPIQVLGLLEAAGMQFDQIWLSSLSDDNWPQAPAPNPFLPIELQRHLGTPRASSAHELEYAQGIMQRIMQSCDTLIASYPQAEGDRELRCSPLIAHFPRISVTDLNLPPATAILPASLETMIDDTAPPLAASETIRGGTRILQLQAKCAFRAFAEIRLGAEDFELDNIGYNAAERGSMVHSVLAKLWEQIQTSERLHSLSETDQQQLIENSVAHVIAQEYLTEDAFFTELNRIEQQRLIILMHQWLNYEKQRSDFKVKAIEYPVELTLAGLPMRMRVDRIDVLADGSELIIDYKTGSPSPSSWFGERPDEPQLPLYVLHNSEVTKGIAFAQLKPHVQRFHGITACANQLPNVKAITTWDDQVVEWQKHLTQLAIDFSKGKAEVNPKTFPASCADCRLASLCRITEQQENEL